ncbi:hypothetical protein BDN72DRAFT_310297 [Pluteus cervinus]|uniref:Uncharacterized protein n=1 Tax=Pluteus cervinus TaxID=181527 RepID=A0ACD3AE36_9AGAR|nr:hypothetical protein BDN72DRAFT_310297 [Pluteus cervinus]
MVRDEYVEAFNWLSSLESCLSQFSVICGPAGIGKTLFLYYCLVRRLSMKLPTAFSLEPEERVFVFHEGGVRDLAPRAAPSFCLRGWWALLDAGQASDPPPSSLVIGFRVVLASSDKRQYKGWVKQRHGMLYHMKTWTCDEIRAVASIQQRPSLPTLSTKAWYERFPQYAALSWTTRAS